VGGLFLERLSFFYLKFQNRTRGIGIFFQRLIRAGHQELH